MARKAQQAIRHERLFLEALKRAKEKPQKAKKPWRCKKRVRQGNWRRPEVPGVFRKMPLHFQFPCDGLRRETAIVTHLPLAIPFFLTARNNLFSKNCADALQNAPKPRGIILHFQFTTLHFRPGTCCLPCFAAQFRSTYRGFSGVPLRPRRSQSLPLYEDTHHESSGYQLRQLFF